MHPFLLTEATRPSSPAKPIAVEVDPRRARRELRLRIGRLRRRIDRRVRSLERERSRLLSWRTYVRRYPGHALLVAMGLGLAASTGFSRDWRRLLGVQLARRVLSRAIERVWKEVEAIWAESEPDRPQTTGAEHGRS